MQKPEFSLICDDTFYKIFSASILAFFCIFISLDIGGSGELFYTDSPLRSQRAKPSLTIVFMFLALLYLRSGSKEAARVEFDELKISFRRGLDKYDLMLRRSDRAVVWLRADVSRAVYKLRAVFETARNFKILASFRIRRRRVFDDQIRLCRGCDLCSGGHFCDFDRFKARRRAKARRTSGATTARLPATAREGRYGRGGIFLHPSQPRRARSFTHIFFEKFQLRH